MCVYVGVGFGEGGVGVVVNVRFFVSFCCGVLLFGFIFRFFIKVSFYLLSLVY